MIAAYDASPTDLAIQVGASDDSALLRRAAASALANSDATASASVLAPLLNDPVRAVRIETAQVLAGIPAKALATTSADDVPATAASALARAIDEYIAEQELNADRPEAHLNLGLLYEKENREGQAEDEFKAAMSLDPTFAPAAVDLADLYRAENRDQADELVLQQAFDRSPNDASLRHAYGLLLVRQKRSSDALGTSRRQRVLNRVTRATPTSMRSR